MANLQCDGDLLFDDLSHTYTLHGRVIPSVTQIIAPLYDFGRIDPDVLAAKAELGKAVHKATELHDRGVLDEASVHERVRPYLAAWRAFRTDTGFQPEAIEWRVCHRGLGYAGTLDRLGVVNKRGWLLDIKTTVALSPAVGVQLAAYAHAGDGAEGCLGGLQRRAVQLRPDGTYRLSTAYTEASDLTTFLSLLNIFNWRKTHE